MDGLVVLRPEGDARARARWRVDRQRYRRHLIAALDALCGIAHPTPPETIDYADLAKTWQQREPARNPV